MTITDEQREAALECMARAMTLPFRPWEDWLGDAKKALDALIASGWEPRPVVERAGWMPIETFSGQDGEVVLAIHRDDLFPVCAFRIEGEWLRQTEGPEDEYGPGKWGPIFRAPTHWMPLPAPPALTPATTEQEPPHDHGA